MKNKLSILALLFTILSLFSGCAVVGGIFKAGLGVGIFLVVVVIAIIFFIVRAMGNRNNP